jgi:hypothetical protein
MPSWRAVYEDGFCLEQFNAQGVEVAKYTDIDRVRLRQFIVIGDDGKPILVLHLKPPSKLIYRQRVARSVMTGEETRVVLVGWQETRNGANFQSLTAIFPDHLEVVDGFDEGHPWLYPVKFLPEEE